MGVRASKTAERSGVGHHACPYHVGLKSSRTGLEGFAFTLAAPAGRASGRAERRLLFHLPVDMEQRRPTCVTSFNLLAVTWLGAAAANTAHAHFDIRSIDLRRRRRFVQAASARCGLREENGVRCSVVRSFIMYSGKMSRAAAGADCTTL